MHNSPKHRSKSWTHDLVADSQSRKSIQGSQRILYLGGINETLPRGPIQSQSWTKMTFFERQIHTGQLGQLLISVSFLGLEFPKDIQLSLGYSCIKYDFIQAIAIGKTFINGKHLIEKQEGQEFYSNKLIKRYMNFMGVMRKDAEVLLLEYARARFSFGVSDFLQHKKVGDFLHFYYSFFLNSSKELR